MSRPEQTVGERGMAGAAASAQTGQLQSTGEAYFRTVFEFAADGILIADRDGTYLDADPRMCAMLGYAHDELVGLHARDILITIEHDGSAEALAAIRGHADYQRAWRCRCKDASQFDAEVLVNPLPDGNLIACIRDMGGRREAEAASRHLAAIVESSEDAITSTTLDNLISSWNRGAERMTGYRAEEMLGRSLSALLPEEFLLQDGALVAAILRGEHVSHFESCRLRKDRRRLIVSSSAAPIRDAVGRSIGISRISRNITAQRENERKLARLRRRYAALSQIDQAIVWQKTRPARLQKVCDALVEFGQFSMAWIGMVEATSQRMLPQPVSGDSRGVQLAQQLLPERILLDIQLPQRDGYLVAADLRAAPCLAATRIIAVTSCAMGGDRERALAAGCDGYIGKPINPETFIHEISAFLPPAPTAEGTQ